MPPSEDLTGRVAIVTGAGQGMGRAVARALAARGATVVVNDRVAETAEAAAAELRDDGGEVTAIVADVVDRAAVRRMVEEAAISLHEAVAAASITPATLVGRPDLGRLAPGARADLVLLDGRLQVEEVLPAHGAA